MKLKKFTLLIECENKEECDFLYKNYEECKKIEMDFQDFLLELVDYIPPVIYFYCKITAVEKTIEVKKMIRNEKVLNKDNIKGYYIIMKGEPK